MVLFFFIQTGHEIVEISDLCPLLTESGEVMDPDIDKYMDFHFNSLLENVHLWRTRSVREDTNLLGNALQMNEYLNGRKSSNETTDLSIFKALVICTKSVNWQHLCEIVKAAVLSVLIHACIHTTVFVKCPDV